MRLRRSNKPAVDGPRRLAACLQVRWLEKGGTCALLEVVSKLDVLFAAASRRSRRGAEEEGREHAIDKRERQLREVAKQAHDELFRAQERAALLPPLEWGDWGTCATCGDETAVYQVFADGRRVLIPGCVEML